MKLAEALSIRAELQKKVGHLKSRLKDSAKVPKGETPAEDLNSLFAELKQTLEELERIIFLINKTNLLSIHEGESITALIARRDVLALRSTVMHELLNHVVGRELSAYREVVPQERTVDVAQLRKDADQSARELRLLDLKIQGLNWTVDLLEA